MEDYMMRDRHVVTGRKALWKRDIKTRARYLYTRALKFGWLVRRSCAICGNPKTQGHHADYGLPYSVHWLCSQHHRLADKLMTNNVAYKRSIIIELERKYQSVAHKQQEVSQFLINMRCN
jgi:hypothetical protein